jgi:SSS family solute:Na+ symporter
LFKAGGLEIPFLLTTIVAVALIWVYTYKSGLKLIVWTDTLQTTFMLLSVVLTIVFLISKLNYSSEDIWSKLSSAGLTKCFYFEDGWSNPNNFFKQFLGGMFITIVMTGLDQDMMQKNLSCRNLKDAQKNMYSFSFVIIMVNFLFLFLGALLYLYMSEFDISIPQKIVNGESKPAFDLVFPNLAMGYLPYYIGVVFIVGLVAAAYSTADSGLTALTTSFCIDILNIDVKDNSKKNLAKRQYVHFAMSVLLCLMIFGFWLVNDDSVINQLFVIAGYTYGPLLGLFMFGLFCKRSLKDRFVPVVCASSPLFTFILNHYSTQLLYGYKFGFELLLINGLITYFGLFIISFKDSNFVKN